MIDIFQLFERVGSFTRKLRSVEDRCRVRSDVLLEIRDKDGRLKHRSFQHNLRVNGGADFWSTQLFGVSGINGQTGTAGYMALTADSTAPNATDTTLPSEITTNGLGRTTQLTPTHSAGASSSSFSHTWTYTGSTSVTIAKVGLFNASSSGTLVLETLLASTGTVNANGDTISVTWTINY
jgi:hypothetical protein